MRQNEVPRHLPLGPVDEREDHAKSVSGIAAIEDVMGVLRAVPPAAQTVEDAAGTRPVMAMVLQPFVIFLSG